MRTLAHASIGCLLASVLALTGCDGSRNTSEVKEAQEQESVSSQLIEQGTDEDTSSDRKAAEWALSRGGKVELADGTTIEEASELPSGPFEVVGINVWTKERMPITVDDLELVAGLSRLRSLNLRGQSTPDEAIAALQNLDSLRVLNLHNTGITDSGLQHLQGLTNLEDLDVGYNKEITDIGIGCLKELSNLKHLCIYYSQLTDSGLASLSGMLDLEYLEVHYTSVTPNGLVQLEPLKALKKLVVAKSFSDEELSQIQAALPACNIVRR